MKKLNNLTQSEYSDEWYTTEDVATRALDLLGFVPNRLLCPFDTSESNFVRCAQQRSIETIFGMRDFLWMVDYECDAIVTNPPFSMKDDVIERCYEYGVPTVLVLPLDVLGGRRRHELYERYGAPGAYVPKRRFNYIDGSGRNRSASNFHSVFLLLNVNNTSGTVVFE